MPCLRSFHLGTLSGTFLQMSESDRLEVTSALSYRLSAVSLLAVLSNLLLEKTSELKSSKGSSVVQNSWDSEIKQLSALSVNSTSLTNVWADLSDNTSIESKSGSFSKLKSGSYSWVME